MTLKSPMIAGWLVVIERDCTGSSLTRIFGAGGLAALALLGRAVCPVRASFHT
jgi:hypothetical protein